MEIKKIFSTKNKASTWVIKSVKLLLKQSKELDSIGIRVVQRPDKQWKAEIFTI